MHFEIRSTVQAGHKLNKVQRTSSGFTETPVVAGKILRRGTVVKLSPIQYDLVKPRIDKLLKSHSIVVKKVENSEVVDGVVETKDVAVALDGDEGADAGGGDSGAGGEPGAAEQVALPPDLAPTTAAVAAPVVAPPAPVIPPVLNQPSYDRNSKHNKKGR